MAIERHLAATAGAAVALKGAAANLSEGPRNKTMKGHSVLIVMRLFVTPNLG